MEILKKLNKVNFTKVQAPRGRTTWDGAETEDQ